MSLERVLINTNNILSFEQGWFMQSLRGIVFDTKTGKKSSLICINMLDL